MDQKIHDILLKLPKWQADPIYKTIAFQEREIKELIGIITTDTKENLMKYELLASFIGYNNLNINNLSLKALIFLYEHKKELKSKIKAEELLDFSSAFDTFVLVRKKHPETLKEISDLFSFFRDSDTGITLKELK